MYSADKFDKCYNKHDKHVQGNLTSLLLHCYYTNIIITVCTMPQKMAAKRIKNLYSPYIVYLQAFTRIYFSDSLETFSFTIYVLVIVQKYNLVY